MSLNSDLYRKHFRKQDLEFSIKNVVGKFTYFNGTRKVIVPFRAQGHTHCQKKESSQNVSVFVFKKKEIF